MRDTVNPQEPWTTRSTLLVREVVGRHLWIGVRVLACQGDRIAPNGVSIEESGRAAIEGIAQVRRGGCPTTEEEMRIDLAMGSNTVFYHAETVPRLLSL